jgi:quercetin dioxygenase-like cupin family protein
VDNERVKVTEWLFPRAAETGWHRHEYDYVIVPQTTGRLLVEAASDSSTSELVSGKSYFRRSGVEHNVVNISEGEFVFLEVELKP